MSDEEGLEQVRDLLAQEGLCLGLSSGINVAGAMKLARQLGPGKRIVTILADTGFRYLSTLYNRQWLEQKGLTVFTCLDENDCCPFGRGGGGNALDAGEPKKESNN